MSPSTAWRSLVIVAILALQVGAAAVNDRGSDHTSQLRVLANKERSLGDLQPDNDTGFASAPFFGVCYPVLTPLDSVKGV